MSTQDEFAAGDIGMGILAFGMVINDFWYRCITKDEVTHGSYNNASK